jgi:hypothetical protein
MFRHFYHTSVTLTTLEIVEEGKTVRLNFAAASKYDAELFLDYPDETTFLTDKDHRRHPLARAVGIGHSEPLSIEHGGRRSFALEFGLSPALERFKFSSMILVKIPVQERRPGQLTRIREPMIYRINVEPDKTFSLRDFR